MEALSRIQIADKFAHMWRQSREDAGVSQEYMAKQLGVSKKTVQNWEAGTSCPSQERGFEWFMVLGVQPLPYYLELLYSGRGSDPDDAKIEELLIELIKAMPSDAKRKMLYWASGRHGSSPICVLEMVTAHLQTPLRSRLNVATSIRENYYMAREKGELRQPKHIQPNTELLDKAIVIAKQAVINGDTDYSAVMREE